MSWFKRAIIWMYSQTIGRFRVDRKINLVTLLAVCVAYLAFAVQREQTSINQRDLEHRTTTLATQTANLKATQSELKTAQTDLKEAQVEIQKLTVELNGQIREANHQREVLLELYKANDAQLEKTKKHSDHLVLLSKELLSARDILVATNQNAFNMSDALLKSEADAFASLYFSTSLILK